MTDTRTPDLPPLACYRTDSHDGHRWPAIPVRGGRFYWCAGTPEPEPAERVTVQYDLPGTHPVLTVGISDRARVLIGERIGDSRDPHAGVNWITAIAEPVDVIMTTLEQARVDQIRVARQIHPSDLRTALRAELADRRGSATLAELEDLHLDTYRNDLIGELARMRDDGEVVFAGPRYKLTGKTVQP